MSVPKLAIVGGLLAGSVLALRPALRKRKSNTGTAVAVPELFTETVAIDAHSLNRFLIATAQLAREKGQSPALRDLVEGLITEQRQASLSIQEVVQSGDYLIEPDVLIAPYSHWLAALRNVSLQGFDRSFLRTITEAIERVKPIFAAFTDRDSDSALARHLVDQTARLATTLDQIERLGEVPEVVFDFSN